MLIRVLGKENEALQGSWKHPFTDVPEWADKYVGYAYKNALTKGVSDTQFGTGTANAQMYLTFMLRALGYSDANGSDFVWDNPYTLAKTIGILPDCVNLTAFWRADVVIISYAALPIALKGTTQTLAQKLIAAGVFTQQQYDSHYDLNFLNRKTENTKLSSQQISQKCSPAVFYIEIYSFNGENAGSGSGFFISADGLAITNYHVAANSSLLKVITPDGKTYSDVTIIDVDKANDLALLRVHGANSFPYLEIGNSDILSQGDLVYAIGSPRGLSNTMSQGIVSNATRELEGVQYIQISVPIAPGSSGGALINEYGKVVGITSAGFLNSTGDLNLAIPSNRINTLDKTSTSDLVAWGDSFYPGFSEVYDFGDFSGVTLLNTIELPLGYILRYDAFDFYDVADYDASDCYANTMFYYYRALLNNGFSHTAVVDDFFGTFETPYEKVRITVDLEKDRCIYIVAERIPQYYKDATRLPDLGWYMNFSSELFNTVGNSIMYQYKWSDDYYRDDFLDMLNQYFKLLESQGFTCKYSDATTFLFEGKGLSVAYIMQGTNIFVDIAPL